jgi:hypothetical protein
MILLATCERRWIAQRRPNRGARGQKTNAGKKKGRLKSRPGCGNLEPRSWRYRLSRHRPWGLTRHESRFHQRHLDRSGRDMEICPKAEATKKKNPVAWQIITAFPRFWGKSLGGFPGRSLAI